jgi:drug/metabolite transporter (DMT)-like permease
LHPNQTVPEIKSETAEIIPPRSRLKSDLILFFVAVAWGSGFIPQRIITPYINVFQFNGLRFLIGALLLAIIFRPWSMRLKRDQMGWIALAGFFLFAGAGLQQWGIIYTTAGNAGFITGLYVVLVPIILSLTGRKIISAVTWAAAGLATAGVFLLSSSGTLRLTPGDGLELAGAILWAMHVIIVGHAAKRMDTLHFTIGQFLVCGLLNLVVAFFLAPLPLSTLTHWLPAVLYSSIISIAFGFSLQVVGQKHAPDTDAALILSMESVFAALFGFLLLGEQLGPFQLLGCGLILAAIVLAQLRT